MNQVHKETLNTVDNALPNRANLDFEIFGMEGIPEDIAQQHNQRVLQAYYEAEAERRAATGNPPKGSGEGNGANGQKRIKTENIDDLKKRLAEFKARKAAGLPGHEVTMADAGAVQSPSTIQGDNAYVGHAIIALDTADKRQPQGPSPPQGGFPHPGYGAPQFSPPQAFPGTPSPYGGLPPQPKPSLPQAPHLPSRPTASVPYANQQQLQQMHQGMGAPPTPGANGNAADISASVDDLISSAIKPTETPGAAAAAEAADRKSKKTDKNTRLVYDDNDVSPEEKMARLPKYHVDMSNKDKEEKVLGDFGPSVTGTDRGYDEALPDPMDR